ncbi:MAG: trypsin-like peptidase domain-containing protein [Deltaproteobacteria bacterium]|nr:trypsin-like peptidase domain-containing protein [Deltaproteobacteria bacterium]
MFVEVRRYGNAHKFVAEVEAISHACDLALLTVDDPAFFHGTAALELGLLSRLGDRVSVCGYPIGGDRISITEGIVSRIELVRYAQSQRRLLAVQLDAAINSGNSGGPVIQDGRLAGTAFQALEDAETIGYMVAPTVVEHFLRDVARGQQAGFPELGVLTQVLESRAHRRSLGLGQRRGGVLVTCVDHGGSAAGVLEPGYVLIEVNFIELANDGTVPLREGELIDHAYLVSSHHVGESLPVRFLRASTLHSATLTLRALAAEGPGATHEARPRYYVVGGLVFVPLTRRYLETWGDDWERDAPRALVAVLEEGGRTAHREEPVVLHKVLADRVKQGYHELEGLLVREVGGVAVRSLGHLVECVEAGRGPFIRFRAGSGHEVVLDRAESRGRHEALLGKFGVPFDRSLGAGEAEDRAADSTRLGQRGRTACDRRTCRHDVVDEDDPASREAMPTPRDRERLPHVLRPLLATELELRTTGADT